MKNFILLLMLSILVGACATNDLTIGVTEPAPISIPGNLKKVGVINRTNTVTTGISNKVDQVLSLELLTNDSLVAIDAVSGLADELRKNKRFTEVKNLYPALLNNSYIDVFSPTLTKEQVDKICTKNNLDALFVLEFFDTNTNADFKANPVKRVVLGTEVTVVETMATVKTLIKLGWKIYDASGDIVYDEFPVSKMVISSGEGINPLKALAAVVGHKDLVKNNVYSMGQTYAKDLLPFYHRVNRIYYVKGSNNFKIGKRLARA